MERVIENIYNDLLELSNIEMQYDYWLGRNPNHVSSYVELMNRLFDDNDIERFADAVAEKRGFSAEFISELKVLIDLLNKYEEKDTDRQILQDPKWESVVAQAKIVLTEWNINIER